jgi:NAD(P)-dependent dehydrogenase (short-subunit alcohol dehydrogenase family)
MNVPAPQQLLNLVGKVAVITGAGSGIGSGIAIRFAQAGADVAINYRTSERGAQEVASKIAALGRKAVFLRADVTEPEAARRLMRETAEALGGLDVLVNNAGSYPLATLLEMSEQEWDETVAANLRNVHLCTQAAAQQMIGQKRAGAIVNVASIEAENPAPRHAHYDAAKAGVVMYTRAAANELGPHGIRVNSVSPGLIWRENLDRDWPEGVSAYARAVPLGRLGYPEDVADACLFLASPAARWITGANLIVDGGVLTNRVY